MYKNTTMDSEYLRFTFLVMVALLRVVNLFCFGPQLPGWNVSSENENVGNIQIAGLLAAETSIVEFGVNW